MTSELDRSLYFKNLDASRFFAFILVFLAHCFVTTDPIIESNWAFQRIYAWGKVGVLGLEYFFVLSSFLISIVILEEKKQTSNFHLGNFLIRRSLRVWPLYFLIIGIGLIITSFPQLIVGVNPLPPWPYLFFFLVNFYIIQHGTEFLFFIAFLWSISIEEQFYLIWSLFMKFIRLRFPVFCLLMILTSVVFRFLFSENSDMLYFHTISALGNFGIGGLLAYGMFKKHNIILKIKALKTMWVKALYTLMLLSIAFYHQLMSFESFAIFSRLFYALFFSWYILDQTWGENRVFEGGKIKFFNYLGKISYGLYCYHGVVITLLIVILRNITIPQSLGMVFVLFPFIIICVTVLLSHLSYRYFERYFLKLKSKFYTFKP